MKEWGKRVLGYPYLLGDSDGNTVRLRGGVTFNPETQPHWGNLSKKESGTKNHPDLLRVSIGWLQTEAGSQSILMTSNMENNGDQIEETNRRYVAQSHNKI